MTYEQLLATAKKLEGETLKTVTGREFTVRVYMDCPFFTPLSTRQGRSDGRLAAERFVERFNQIGSFRPRDYQDLSRNASYLVVLAEHALGQDR